MSDWFWQFWTGMGGTITPVGDAVQLSSDPQTFLFPVVAGSATGDWEADPGAGFSLNDNGDSEPWTGFGENAVELRPLGLFGQFASIDGLCTFFQTNLDLAYVDHDPDPNVGKFIFDLSSSSSITTASLEDNLNCLASTGSFLSAGAAVQNEFNATLRTSDMFLYTYQLIDPPVARDDTAADLAGGPVSIDALGNDDAPLGNPFTPQIVQAPANGTATVNPDGTITYMPAATFSGVDTFSYKDTNGTSTSNVATVTVQVNHVLDTFARANGPLGHNWLGPWVGGYRIVNDALVVGYGGPIVWSGAFGPNQEAYVTFGKVPKVGVAEGLLLKAQHPAAPETGAINVTYSALTKTVRVWTSPRLGQPQTNYAPIAATFASGDVLGAVARSDGSVEVLKNGSEIGSVTLSAADKAYYDTKSGDIGLTTILTPLATFSNFGGNPVAPS